LYPFTHIERGRLNMGCPFEKNVSEQATTVEKDHEQATGLDLLKFRNDEGLFDEFDLLIFFRRSVCCNEIPAACRTGIDFEFDGVVDLTLLEGCSEMLFVSYRLVARSESAKTCKEVQTRASRTENVAVNKKPTAKRLQ